MRIKKSKGRIAFEIFNYMVLTIVGIVSLYPFLYTITMSFSTAVEASRDTLHIIPGEVTLESYKAVLRNPDIYTGYRNTILRVVIGTIVSVLLTSSCAYAMSRRETPNRKFWSMFVLFTMLFHGGLIPSFLVNKSLGLIDNFLVYILPSAVGAYNLIIFKNSFMGMPEELFEAAKIDGASHFRIFFQIVIPLSKATFATVILWVVVGYWNSWYDAMIYMNNENLWPLQMFLRRIIQENATGDMLNSGMELTEFTSETVKAATTVVSMLPVLCAYPFIQKYFVGGVMLGSVKG